MNINKRQITLKGLLKKLTIQRNWQHWAHKTQDEDNKAKTHQSAQTHPHKVSQTSALLHIIGGKERTEHRFYTAIVT